MQSKIIILTARMGIAVATLGAAGLTACDPSPPLFCDNFQNPQLRSSATWDGTILEIRITDSCTQTGYPCPRWSNVAVSDLTGAELDNLQPIDAGVVIRLRAGSDGGVAIAHGAFSLRFTTYSPDSKVVPDPCATLSRTFSFSVQNGTAVVGEQDAGAFLGDSPPPAIRVVRVDGTTLVLHATVPKPGAEEWTVSGGCVGLSTDGQAHWTVPERPGVYMAELVVRGESHGLGRDVLVVEVTSDAQQDSSLG